MAFDDLPINRREIDFIGRKGKPRRLMVNKNIYSHPFQNAREYTRALNATKLSRVFAKPFIGALSGSLDSIWSLTVIPKKLSLVVSGDCNGDLRVWNVSNKKLNWSSNAHSGFVNGICCYSDGTKILSCGNDKVVKIWNIEQNENKNISPIRTILGKNGFSDIDTQYNEKKFVTVGDEVELWDFVGSEPVVRFKKDFDTFRTIKFNKVEKSIFCASANDRGVYFYDIRTKSMIKKVIMAMASNSISWNPMEAFNLTFASEDSNLYTFDMRYLNRATKVHEDHLNAVMSVDHSPTGKEFVSGSYDKTIRIFDSKAIRSKEVYHTKRMQRVFVVKFSLDASFVFSGSDDANIRIWKSNASEKLGVLTKREENYFKYCEKIKAKYKHMPDIKKISRHRHLPKNLYNEKKKKEIMKKAQDKKLNNLNKHKKEPIKKESKNFSSILRVEN